VEDDRIRCHVMQPVDVFIISMLRGGWRALWTGCLL
jgi:hypothetical protein